MERTSGAWRIRRMAAVTRRIFPCAATASAATGLPGSIPAVDAMELLEKDKTGKPISNKTYGIGGMREYWACLNNPNWRQVLKAWVRFSIAQGVDGFIANYFYRHDCLCPHCVTGFRRYL